MVRCMKHALRTTRDDVLVLLCVRQHVVCTDARLTSGYLCSRTLAREETEAESGAATFLRCSRSPLTDFP